MSPTELEDIMQSHPAVRESLAFGKADYKVQEIITMVVVLNEGYSVSGT